MKFQLLIPYWRIGLLLSVLGFGAPSAYAQVMCIEDVVVHPDGDITIDDEVSLEVDFYGNQICVFWHPIEVRVAANRVVVEILIEPGDCDGIKMGFSSRTISLGNLRPGAYEYSIEIKPDASYCDQCSCTASGNLSVSGGACCVDGQCQEVMQPECVRWGGTFLGDGTRCSILGCAETVPVVSDWGMVALILILGVGLTLSTKNTTRRNSTTMSGSW